GRWVVYAIAGGVSAATVGPWLVVVLLGCGVLELSIHRFGRSGSLGTHPAPHVLLATAAAGTRRAFPRVLAAVKVGAPAHGRGVGIIPLMQHDAVHAYGWMTNSQFLDAVALGQITPGPVVQTVAVVGYAAFGVPGALLAAAVAFAPSFTFVLVGARHFQAFRRNENARAFLDGAGP